MKEFNPMLALITASEVAEKEASRLTDTLEEIEDLKAELRAKLEKVSDLRYDLNNYQADIEHALTDIQDKMTDNLTGFTWDTAQALISTPEEGKLLVALWSYFPSSELAGFTEHLARDLGDSVVSEVFRAEASRKEHQGEHITDYVILEELTGYDLDALLEDAEEAEELLYDL